MSPTEIANFSQLTDEREKNGGMVTLRLMLEMVTLRLMLEMVTQTEFAKW